MSPRNDRRGRAGLRPELQALFDKLIPPAGAPSSPSKADPAVRRRSAVAGLLAWADGEGLPADPAHILHPAMINRYVAQGLNGTAVYRSTIHAVLYDIARDLWPAGTVPDTAPSRPRAYVADPYTSTETEALLVWASGQRGEQLRNGLLAILATGLGAGITVRELLTLTGASIMGLPGATGVAVTGDSARFVPLLDRYEDLARHVAAAAGDCWLVCPGAKNRTRQTITNLDCR